MLHSNHKHVSIESFEDLANQDVIDYGTLEAGSTMLFFKHSTNPLHQRIYQHMERKKSFVSSTQEGVRRSQEGNFAFIGEAVSLDLAVARYCNLCRSQEVIAMR
ncbi:probable glutamate receptor, partial [Plectropomus leopardus]